MIRDVPFDRLHIFRDLGGYAAAGGRTVRWHALYRSDSLGKLSGADEQRLLDLGVGTVIDLRYPWEADRPDRADRVPAREGQRYRTLSIEHRPYKQASFGNDFGPRRHVADRFWEVAHDGAAEIRQVLVGIAAPDTGPTVFHCTSGKDRSVLIAALVLTLLGVGRDDVLTDFVLTELASARLAADWKAAHPDRTVTWAGYGRAPADILLHFLTDIDAAYGSLTGYASVRLGVDDALVRALRDKLLTD